MSFGGRPPVALRRPSPDMTFADEDASVTETLDTFDYAVLPDYLLMANELMKQMNQKKRIKNPNGLASNIFIPLYEAVTKRRLSGVIRHPQCKADFRRNLRLLLDQISADLKDIPLSHITPDDLLSGDRVAVCNLLEIIQGLTEYALKKGKAPGQAGDGPSSEENGLSTYRSEASTLGNCDDLTDISEVTETPGSEVEAHVLFPSKSAHRKPESPMRELLRCASDPSLPRRSFSPPQRDTDAGWRPPVTDAQSAGSSVSSHPESPPRRLSSRSLTKCSKLQKRMQHMEAQADKVTLVAQLLSNCALVDRITARRGRRAIRSLLKETQAAASERSLSSDEETFCDNSEADDLSSVLSKLDDALDPKSLRGRYAQTLNLVQDGKQVDLDHLRERLVAGTAAAPKPQRSQSMRCLGPRPKPSGGLVRPREVPLRRGPCSVSSLESNGSSSTVGSERSGLLEFLMQEMPGLSLSQAALRRLHRYAGSGAVPKASASPLDSARSGEAAERHRAAAERRIAAEAQRRERVLGRLVRRELSVERRLRDLSERRNEEQRQRTDDRERRQGAARAQRYGEEVARGLQSLRSHTEHSNEQIVREALAQGAKSERELRLDRERQRREKEADRAGAALKQVEAAEAFFHDKYCELTESAKDEKEAIEAEAKKMYSEKSRMKQELRAKLEADIQAFQANLRSHTDDDAFFRRLDAQRALDRRISARR